MGEYVPYNPLPSTCFTCTRLNSSTYRIVEDDKYGEHPFIYVKVTPRALVLIDTGCGGAVKDPGVELTSLRTFLETYPVTDEGEALNEEAAKDYVVVCTHCHYDHIGGVEAFTDAKSFIWASGYDKSFLSRENLPTSSLCKYLDLQTPKYEIAQWAGDGAPLTYKGDDLGLVTYQTPGHTPDELAVWDPSERVLFVGDSVYEWAAIIFPKEGSLVWYSDSMGKLRRLVKEWNGSAEDTKVTMACGHITADADAEDLLAQVDDLLWDVASGKIAQEKEEEVRGELCVLYARGDGRLSFYGPKRLFDDFEGNPEAMNRLQKRVTDGV